MSWHSELSGARAAAWQSIVVSGQSIGSEAVAAVTHNLSQNRYLVEAPGWAHNIRGIR